MPSAVSASVASVPITSEHAGREYPPTPPYPVTRAKIGEFATALGQADEYSGPDPEAPPTFAVVVTNAAWQAMFADPELELSLSRIIHADQRFHWHRALRAGDVVTATLRIERVRVRAGSEMISLTVTVHDSDGATVVSAEATFFHTRDAAT